METTTLQTVGQIATIQAEIFTGDPDQQGTPKSYRKIQVHAASGGNGVLVCTPFDDALDDLRVVNLPAELMTDLRIALGLD